jgi:hypothetical protein
MIAALVALAVVIGFVAVMAGDANKVFLIPSEFSQAFGGISRALEQRSGPEAGTPETPRRSQTLELAGRPRPRQNDDDALDQPAWC